MPGLTDAYLRRVWRSAAARNLVCGWLSPSIPFASGEVARLVSALKQLIALLSTPDFPGVGKLVRLRVELSCELEALVKIRSTFVIWPYGLYVEHFNQASHLKTHSVEDILARSGRQDWFSKWLEVIRKDVFDNFLARGK
ncbi:MAG TPA: hypothetical protein VFE47_04670 [Tepidisphaeraceae bacterium]|jgi:hypothetical protein|nr:hypothetical protein [Tepidisphaeraceae bacterium]